jgi:hypothetical protein
MGPETCVEPDCFERLNGDVSMYCDRHRGKRACASCGAQLHPAYALAVCEQCARAEREAPTLPEVARPPVEQRPLVHHGEVAATLFNDLRALFGRLRQLEAFEQHVMNAAKSPAAWLSLRQELAK